MSSATLRHRGSSLGRPPPSSPSASSSSVTSPIADPALVSTPAQDRSAPRASIGLDRGHDRDPGHDHDPERGHGCAAAGRLGLPPSPPPSDSSSSSPPLSLPAAAQLSSHPLPGSKLRSASAGSRRASLSVGSAADSGTSSDGYDAVQDGGEDERAAAVEGKQAEESHPFGGLHWLPMAFAVVPAVGALIHGDARGWTDGLVIGLFGGLVLWQLAKIPWAMFAASRAARLANLRSESFHSSPSQRRRRRSTTSGCELELNRYEIVSLLLCFACPALGFAALAWARGALSTEAGRGLLSETSVVLYAAASGVKPLTTASALVLDRIAYLQSIALGNLEHGDESDSDVDSGDDHGAGDDDGDGRRHRGRRNHGERESSFSLAFEGLEAIKADSAALKERSAGKAELEELREELDGSLGRLSRGVRRSARGAEVRAAEVDARFEELEKLAGRLETRVGGVEESFRMLEAYNPRAGWEERRGGDGDGGGVCALLLMLVRSLRTPGSNDIQLRRRPRLGKSAAKLVGSLPNDEDDLADSDNSDDARTLLEEPGPGAVARRHALPLRVLRMVLLPWTLFLLPLHVMAIMVRFFGGAVTARSQSAQPRSALVWDAASESSSGAGARSGWTRRTPVDGA